VASQAGQAHSSSSQLAVSVPAQSAKVGVAYNSVPSVSGGSAPYTFYPEGNLPPGIKVNQGTGSITGVPTIAGTYSFSLLVSDPLRNQGTGVAHIVVAAASTQGPAIVVSPGNTTIASRGVQQFTASVTGTSNTAVTWSATAGTISSNGNFTAPVVSSNTSVTITAMNSGDGAVSGKATALVTPPAQLTLVKSILAEANAGVAYSESISATGGTTPYRWSVAAGTLPFGIKLQASTGVLTGTTSATGSFPFTAKVTDSVGNSSTQSFTLTVATGSASGFDGPAELPRVYIQTAMANTPTPGTTISVSAGGDLQSALNSADCGDTIQLQAGATFTGVFTFPAKSCDDNHWIILRTSASDSALPAEDNRLTPCYAGVSFLPGRPALGCSAPKNVLAKLVMPTSASGPIIFASGANHYRLIGLEITRLTGTGDVYALSSIAVGGTANNLIFDRVWMHGTAHDDTTRGVSLGGSTYVSIIDSFLTDFHCVSVTGACTDAQAINGGLGNSPMGPYKIADNFLEASGQSILFGGGIATATPTDIEIRRNHMFKPFTWMKGQLGYVGGTNGNPFIVKNHFELKNAQRVLMDGNIMENSWGGFSQVGFAILLTPKNQSSGSSNVCPACQVTDVTIRNSSIRHVAAGIQIANGRSDNGGVALAGERYSIHDVIVDDIDGVKYDGPGEFAEVAMGLGSPVLRNVTINHVTAFPTSTLMTIGGQLAPNPRMTNFVFTNSIVLTGPYPVWSTGGGPTNCAYHDSPLTTFNACFSGYSFTHVAVIGSSSNFPVSTWPKGNFFPSSGVAVQFVNYNAGSGGDYHLRPSSPYKGVATDGKDLGADVDAVDSAIAGVE
jgi:hypothetical protein